MLSEIATLNRSLDWVELELTLMCKHQKLALLNPNMNCPHPQPFSLGRREPEALFPLHLGEG